MIEIKKGDGSGGGGNHHGGKIDMVIGGLSLYFGGVVWM